MISGLVHNFIFLVLGKHYLVASFVLTLLCGAVHELNLALPVGLLFNLGLEYSKVTSPFYLYKQLQLRQSFAPILVMLYDDVAYLDNILSGDELTSPEPLFKGILVSVQPLVNAKGSLYISCKCLGMPAKLMYSPLADFIVAPNGTQTAQNLQKSGLGIKPSLILAYRKKGHGIFAAICQSLKAAQKDTLLKLFQVMQDKILLAMKKVLGAQGDTYTAGPRISDFIKSLYVPGYLAGTLKGIKGETATSEYMRFLGLSFLGYIQSGGTIYQCVLNTLDDDVFLRLVPDATGLYMYISPTYDMIFEPEQDVSITASDMTSMNPSLAAAQFMRTPGTLYVNFSKASEYGLEKGSNLELNIYGEYRFIQGAQSYKMILAPVWCLSRICALKGKNSDYNPKADMDKVALLMYYLRYGRGSTCTIELAPTATADKLRSCIGRPVRIDSSNIKVNNILIQDMKDILCLYGLLKWYLLRYTAASQSSSSSIGIRIGLDRFWSKKSPFSKLFTLSVYNGLYEKKV